jgi:hypothetical protein
MECDMPIPPRTSPPHSLPVTLHFGYDTRIIKQTTNAVMPHRVAAHIKHLCYASYLSINVFCHFMGGL